MKNNLKMIKLITKVCYNNKEYLLKSEIKRNSYKFNWSIKGGQQIGRNGT
jgi:hypothetical protein